MRRLRLVFLLFAAAGCAREMSAPATLTSPAAATRTGGSVAYKTLYSFKAAADGSRAHNSARRHGRHLLRDNEVWRMRKLGTVQLLRHSLLDHAERIRNGSL